MRLLMLRERLPERLTFVLAIAGIAFVLGVWSLLTAGAQPMLPRAILPGPDRVFLAFGDLYRDNDIIRNTSLSVGLNLAGYVEAILIAIPAGFLIGLLPVFRGGFQYQVNAIRYIPLTAVIGMFIAWFGVGTEMRVHFLAFGILIYLLPVIIQRIDEVEDVYLKTVSTIGASPWQTIRSVYIPSVISRVSDDIRVLTAISWTYIIVAEGIAASGGIGSLIWRVGMRQGRMDKVFAMLIIIMVIGVLQDRLLVLLDRELFPHKYQTREHGASGRIQKFTIWQVLWQFALGTFLWILAAGYLVLLINEFVPLLGDFRPLSYLFGDTVWVVHFIVLLLIGYFVNKALRGQTVHALTSRATQ